MTWTQCLKNKNSSWTTPLITTLWGHWAALSAADWCTLNARRNNIAEPSSQLLQIILFCTFCSLFHSSTLNQSVSLWTFIYLQTVCIFTQLYISYYKYTLVLCIWCCSVGFFKPWPSAALERFTAECEAAGMKVSSSRSESLVLNQRSVGVKRVRVHRSG